jgi:hypothetical protein
LIDKERIELIKEEKLAEINKKMQINIRRMIEKEKTKETLGLLNKSPDSLRTKKVLIELQVIHEKADVKS